jgi:phosphonate transport system substrate-binding protein
MLKRWALWLLVLCPALVACSPPSEETPARLRIAVLPDQSPELLHRQHDSLVAYLGKTLGMPSELVLLRDYSDVSMLFHEHKVDLVYFGGLTFVNARRFDSAIPIATRDIDLRFTSTFLARQGVAGKTIEDFRGKRFSFGSKLSTSGHLMPRYFLQKRSIEPEKFFSEVRYSGAHDKTVQWILHGDVDLGVVNTYIFESMIDKGLVKRSDFRIVGVTPPYPDYVWAVRPGLSTALRQRLQQAFLALTPENPEYAEILKSQSAGGFLPVKNTDFDPLEAVAENLGLLKTP